MKHKILLVTGFVSVSMLMLFANEVVHGQNKKTESNIATAAKTGRNCGDNKCSSAGGCASCVELLVSLPLEAHVDDIQCMSNAGGEGGDYLLQRRERLHSALDAFVESVDDVRMRVRCASVLARLGPSGDRA
jgi:hypothetical protein